MIQEQFAAIPGYSGYKVSNHGYVVSKRLGKKLRTNDNGGGYQVVKLYSDDGKLKNFYVHRLVAEAFLYNSDNLPQVNHIDNCKRNNYIKNLEWVSPKANTDHKLVNRFFTFATQLPGMDLTRWITV